MKTKAYGTTNQGKARDRNEDSFAIEPDLGLSVVCDGLGGHAAGEVASKGAVEAVVRYIKDRASVLNETPGTKDGRLAIRKLVDEAINEASRTLCELALTNSDYAGMGTTLTLALVWKNNLVVGHVGDSRIYLLRDGEIRRLTSDHTMAAELGRRGQLTPEEVERSPLANALSRVVGAQKAVLVETLCLDANPGDVFLACSDGLYRYFEDQDLAEHLSEGDLSEAPSALTDLANERGGADNITAVVIQVSQSVSKAAKARSTIVQRRLKALGCVPFLRGLALRHLALLLEVMESRAYEAGELVLAVGDPLEGLYVLVDGHVAGLGVKLGDNLGERDLTRTEPAETELRATSDSEVLFLSASSLRRMGMRHPVLCTRLFWNLLARGIVDSGS